MNNQAFSKIWIIIIVIVLFAGGIFAWQYFRVPKEEVKAPEGGEPTNWERHTKSIYQNEKHGFQLVMPFSWKDYAIKEEIREQTTIIHFGLPLESDEISQWLLEPERTEEIFYIWSIHIMPISEWESEKRKCEDPSVDYPCFYPQEIVRNEKYVFGSGFYFIAGGWDPCMEDESVKKKEAYFCSVYWDMSSARGYDVGQSFSLLPR